MSIMIILFCHKVLTLSKHASSPNQMARKALRLSRSWQDGIIIIILDPLFLLAHFSRGNFIMQPANAIVQFHLISRQIEWSLCLAGKRRLLSSNSIVVRAGSRKKPNIPPSSFCAFLVFESWSTKIGRVVLRKVMGKRIVAFFYFFLFFSFCRYRLTIIFFSFEATLTLYNKQYIFSKKATNTFVRLVMKSDLAKFCFTTLKNQRANKRDFTEE